MAIENRTKRKKLPEEVAQGAREMTDYERYVSEHQPVEQQEEKPVVNKGILRKTAEFGLLPAAAAAKGLGSTILKGTKFDTTKMSIKDIQSATADTPVGYTLGLGTVALETYLGARALGRVTGKMGVKGREAVKSPVLERAGFVPDRAVELDAKRHGLSKGAMAQIKRELGKMRVSEIATRLKTSYSTPLGKGLRRFGKVGEYAARTSTPARIGAAGLLGWFGADTMAQGISMRANNVEKNVIFGQSNRSQGLTDLQELSMYNNIGKAAILAAVAVSPVTIPLLAFGWASTKMADSQIEQSRRIIEGL